VSNRRRIVADALVRLPPDQRKVIIGAHLGRSVTELADELNIPAETVESRLFFGLDALWHALRETGLVEP
jgi:RNA polymerase sigma-70 factor, ECF subfamily